MNSLFDNIKKKNTALVAVATLLIVLAIVSVFYFSQNTNQAETSLGPKIKIESSASLLYYDLDTLIQESSLIVVGRPLSKSDPFLIKPVGEGSPVYFTDTHLQVDEVLFGDQSRLGSTISVRTEGGETDNIIMTADHVPNLEQGESYILFLYQSDDGVYFNTEGDHFYITAGKVGSYKTTNNGSAYENIATSETITITNLKDLILSLNIEPLNPEVAKSQELSKLKSQLRDGSIDNNSYNAKIEELNEYATILSPKEARQYEDMMLEEVEKAEEELIRKSS